MKNFKLINVTEEKNNDMLEFNNSFYCNKEVLLHLNKKYKLINNYFYEVTSNQTTEKEEAIKCVKTIMFLISLRSKGTLTHSISVEVITRQIYKLLNIEEENFEDIYLAAFCHDIGKIMTPIEVLNKPDTLSYEEMEIMKKHVVYSGKILREFGLESAAKIAESHHEKLDGSGYPYGLAGDEISCASRILAVVDIFSALIERRVYKDAFSKNKVVSILTNLANTNKIDENIVKLVIENYDILTSKIEEVIENTKPQINYFIETYYEFA